VLNVHQLCDQKSFRVLIQLNYYLNVLLINKLLVCVKMKILFQRASVPNAHVAMRPKDTSKNDIILQKNLIDELYTPMTAKQTTLEI
jgi:hypothetical protein